MRIPFLFLLSVFVLVLCMFNCRSGNESAGSAEGETVSGPVYPVLPEEIKNKMLDSCDYIDYIFYELPFSMSQDARSAIVANIRFITNEPIERPLSECNKAIARVIYQIQGDIVAEADLFLSEICSYFVFMENNQPKYANQVSEQGVAFYKQIIQQVTTPAPQ